MLVFILSLVLICYSCMNEHICSWARENKLYMNMLKTKALLVTGKRLRKRIVQDSGQLEVKTDNAEIENVGNHKLLGMIIDEDVTYEVHVEATWPLTPY